jgi:hypothetical protein
VLSVDPNGRPVRGAAQAVVDAQPGAVLRRRFDQDQVGAGAVHRAQRRVQRVREAFRRGRQRDLGVRHGRKGMRQSE